VSPPDVFSRATSQPNCRSSKSTKVELIINLKTAKVFGLTVLPSLIALCRRGDRMKLLLPVHESGSGTSRRFAAMQNLVAIGDIADIEQAAPIKLDL